MILIPIWGNKEVRPAPEPFTRYQAQIQAFVDQQMLQAGHTYCVRLYQSGDEIVLGLLHLSLEAVVTIPKHEE